MDYTDSFCEIPKVAEQFPDINLAIPLKINVLSDLDDTPTGPGIWVYSMYVSTETQIINLTLSILSRILRLPLIHSDGSDLFATEVPKELHQLTAEQIDSLYNKGCIVLRPLHSSPCAPPALYGANLLNGSLQNNPKINLAISAVVLTKIVSKTFHSTANCVDSIDRTVATTKHALDLLGQNGILSEGFHISRDSDSIVLRFPDNVVPWEISEEHSILWCARQSERSPNTLEVELLMSDSIDELLQSLINVDWLLL